MPAPARSASANDARIGPHRAVALLSCTALFAVAMAGMGAPTRAEDRLFDASRPLEVADQGVFSIPGGYVEVDKQTVMIGQMYVQYQIPRHRTRPYAVVMIHGGGQTASNFLATPDGRRGWADDFVANGYAVYVVDQAGRGRSGFFGDSYGKTRKPSAENVEQRFTAPERKQLWPQARLHTQWPGTGVRGDAAFDIFYASQVETIGDEALIEQMNREAGAKLLDRIGPAVLLTHSQAGVIGWSIADERPQLVKGILASSPVAHPSARPSQRVLPTISRTAWSPVPGASPAERSHSIRRRRRRATSSSCGKSRPTVAASCVAFCSPSRRGKCRTCVEFPFSSW